MEVKKLIEEQGGQAAFFRKMEKIGIPHSTVKKWSAEISKPKQWVVALINEYLN